MSVQLLVLSPTGSNSLGQGLGVWLKTVGAGAALMGRALPGDEVRRESFGETVASRGDPRATLTGFHNQAVQSRIQWVYP